MIVNYISKAMGQRRLTIQEVANRSGLSYSTVHALYHNRAKRIDFKTLDAICKAIGVESIIEVLGYLREDDQRWNPTPSSRR